MRTAKFYNAKSECRKRKFGALKPCHLYSPKGTTVPLTLGQVGIEEAGKGFYRPNDPRLHV